MSFGSDSGFAPPPGATPELEHWFAQIGAEIQEISDRLPIEGGIPEPTTQGAWLIGDSEPSWAEAAYKMTNSEPGSRSFLTHPGGSGQTTAWGAIQTGDLPSHTHDAGDITGAGDLTRFNDTNVTVSLGGTPTGALLKSASLTLGWTGVLDETRGGTGFGSYAVGDILHATGTSTLSRLSVGSARQLLQTNSVGTLPEWASNIDIPGTLDVTSATTLDSTLQVFGISTFEDIIDMQLNRVTDMADPQNPQDAVTLSYLSDIASEKTTFSDLWDNLLAFSGNVVLGHLTGTNDFNEGVDGSGNITAVAMEVNGVVYVDGRRAELDYAVDYPNTRSGEYKTADRPSTVIDFTDMDTPLDPEVTYTFYIYVAGNFVPSGTADRHAWVEAYDGTIVPDHNILVSRVQFTTDVNGDFSIDIDDVQQGRELDQYTLAGEDQHDPYIARLFAHAVGAEGEATGGSASTMQDSNRDWETDEWVDEYVTVDTGGTGFETKQITGNSATSLTISGSWTTNPADGDTYIIGVDSNGTHSTAFQRRIAYLANRTNFWAASTGKDLGGDPSNSKHNYYRWGKLWLDDEVDIDTGVRQAFFSASAVGTSSSHSFDVRTAGLNRIRVLSGGDVQIVNDFSVSGAADFVGAVTMQSTLSLDATQRLYFDGGTHTYIHEVSADKLRFVAGGVVMADVDGAAGTWSFGQSGGATFGGAVTMQSTLDLKNNQQLRWEDSGGTPRNILSLSSGNVLQIVNNALGSGGTIGFFNGSGASENMRLTSAGHLALGTTDVEAWGGDVAFQMGPENALFSWAGNMYMVANAYFDGSWKYRTTDPASKIQEQAAGTIIFSVAPSGTADTAISWTDALTIQNDGDVIFGANIGDTSNRVATIYGVDLDLDGTLEISPSDQTGFLAKFERTETSITDGLSLGSFQIRATDDSSGIGALLIWRANGAWAGSSGSRPTDFEMWVHSGSVFHQAILDKDGDFTLSGGNFFDSSSIEKKNIQGPWTGDALEIIRATDLWEYYYKSDSKGLRKVGFIAEDAHPMLVDDTRKFADLHNVIALSLAGIQQLDDRVTALEEKVT